MIKWFEIPVQDLERAKAFYEEVFQMELTPLKLANGLSMALFPEEKGNGALCYYPDFYEVGKQGPLIYLSADPSIDEKLSRVEASGGKVIIPKNQISKERGFMAVFEDSEGNRIALNSAK